MWPTVMRVSTGNEWRKPSSWEHLDLGVGEGCEWDLWGTRGRAPGMEGTEGEDIGKLHNAYTVIIVHTLSHFFPAASSPGEQKMYVRSELLNWL